MSGLHATKHSRRRGFSVPELLCALLILMVVMGMAFTFFVDASEHVAAENAGLQAQQSSRIAIDDLARTIMQAGYGIYRPDAYNAATWQRSLVYGGSHVLAFNADIDPLRGPLDETQTLTLPDGEEYVGDGPSANPTGAETYVYTLDADADGDVTADDRTAAPEDGYNPAAETATPIDFALFKQEHGFTADDWEAPVTPVMGNLFTNAVDDADGQYPNGTTPNPLFTYFVTEDLDGNGILADAECIVTPCPPTATRKPKLYAWGDTDFDGGFSETEKDELRTMPVGSPEWSKNRFATSGDYISSKLTVAAVGGIGAYTLTVQSVTGFAPGQFIVAGTGDDAEHFVIESVTASTKAIGLMSTIEGNHAINADVTILPDTFLHAVRAVQVRWDGVSDQSEERGPGRAGRRGERGLSQRVRHFERTIELPNLQTAALASTLALPPEVATCPVTVAGTCNSAPLTSLTIYRPRSAPANIMFGATNSGGKPVANTNMHFTNQSSAPATLVEADVLTNGYGQAKAQYATTGGNGTDVLSAKVKCKDSNGNQQDSAAGTVNITIATMDVTMSPDCSHTKWGTKTPSDMPFTIHAYDAGGNKNNVSVSVALAFDEAEEAPADFSRVQAELFIGGVSNGTTSLSDGSFTAVSATTNSSGNVTGAVRLVKDDDGSGIRILARATIADVACSVLGTVQSAAVDFHRLQLSSSPTSGCTESIPCSIAAGNTAPYAVATLTRNGIPIANATVTFSTTKISGPSGAQPRLKPSSGIVTTDANGQARVEVVHNGDAGISTITPLVVAVDATATGGEDCTSGTIQSGSSRVGYSFQGSVLSHCDAVIPSISKVSNDTICFNVKNTGQCNVNVVGFQAAMFAADGVTKDGTFLLEESKGGGVQSSVSCDTDDQVQLFKDDCQNPKAKLANDTPWTFEGTYGSCDLPKSPPNPLIPGKYFVVNKLKFSKNYTAGRRVDLTAFYTCSACGDDSVQSNTFTFSLP